MTAHEISLDRYRHARDRLLAKDQWSDVFEELSHQWEPTPNPEIHSVTLSGNFGQTSLQAEIRHSVEAEGEEPEVIADVIIAREGREPRLFRSVQSRSLHEVQEAVLAALGHLTRGAYPDALQFLRSTTPHGRYPLFVELDPQTQLELSGEGVSPSSVSRDLGREGVYHLGRAFDSMLAEILADPELLDEAISDFEEVQERDLGLVNIDTYAVTYPDLSIRPVVIDQYQEEKLARLVSNVISAKIAIVNGAAESHELQELFLCDMNAIGREVIGANLYPIPRHVRIRIDSHTDFEVGESSQIETNGSEPQGDAVTSATLSLFKRTFGRLFKKLGATPEQIENCFRELRLPLYRVADKIASVYAEHQAAHPDLPPTFNVGFFAWKHPTTRKPLSNISNAEAEKSVAFITDNSTINHGYSFDPFDIVRFEELDDPRFHLPVIITSQGDEVPIHFIRRLYGNLGFGGPTWRVLKERNPETFYRFSGIPHEQWNPEGRRIPEWLWMNPLNPCLTDKVLDAIITDENLQRRFQVRRLIAEDLLRNDPSMKKDDAKREARKIIAGCKEFIPLTRCLTRKGDGLFPGDSGPGGLDDRDIITLKNSRKDWVIKLDSLGGYAGHGIFVGRSFLLNEVPTSLLDVLTEEEGEKVKLAIVDTLANSRLEVPSEQIEEWLRLPIGAFWSEPLIRLPGTRRNSKAVSLEEAAMFVESREPTFYADRARDVLWPHLVDHALKLPKSLIQRYRTPQTFNAVRLSYDGTPGSSVSLSLPTPHSVDINVFAFGSEQSDFHSRGSLWGKTNITGGYGARMIVVPSNVARSMVALYRSLLSSEQRP